MIREMRRNEIDAVMQIWLEANIEAHSFIPKEYWQKNYDAVKSMILEGVTVYEEDDEVLGFIGIREGYISGIFVKEGRKSEGIGQKLVDDAKEHYQTLTLNVYLDNRQAVKFYLREEFKVTGKEVDLGTGAEAEEYQMIWKQV